MHRTEYVEAGASATDDRRPNQRMIDRVCDGDNPFDAIVIHSYSRFFRDAFCLELYVGKLAEHGVKLVSITQELGDDPAQIMMRQVISLLAKAFGTARPRFGYRVIAVERRGSRIKKTLAVDLVEAEIVRLIFKLYLEVTVVPVPWVSNQSPFAQRARAEPAEEPAGASVHPTRCSAIQSMLGACGSTGWRLVPVGARVRLSMWWRKCRPQRSPRLRGGAESAQGTNPRMTAPRVDKLTRLSQRI